VLAAIIPTHFLIWSSQVSLGKHAMQHTFRTFWNTNFAFMTISRSAAHQDWHPADVLAALKKRGKTLAGISKANGYHATAAGKALKQPWPAMEAVIAAAIGLAPEEIWPARYAERRPAAAGRGKGAGQR
jgi:Ner family transcriptional regulator